MLSFRSKGAFSTTYPWFLFGGSEYRFTLNAVTANPARARVRLLLPPAPRAEVIAMAAGAAPDGFSLPPERLIVRAGATPGQSVIDEYLAGGAANAETIRALCPGKLGDAGLRLLDFGCGAGKVLRHLTAEARAGEVWGCDIDRDSIAWLQKNLCPPFRAFIVSDDCKLPQPDGYFDLVYAISVFTHITEDWARWLLELHRVLTRDGVAIVTFLGEGMIEVERGGRWDPDRVGMNVLRRGQDWQGGGPTVFHSDWWIEAHWGRAFEIVALHHDRDETGVVRRGSHGFVVLRKRPVAFTAAMLQAPADDPREFAALEHNIEQLHDDDRDLRTRLLAALETASAAEARSREAQARADDLERRLEVISTSHSWRLTRPLRELAQRGRRA